MEVNHKFIHGPFEDEEEEEDFLQKVGMGRSYDCVFCRRGFTTAQALGGHMNVHRRDRATNNHNPNPTHTKPSSSCSTTKPSNLHDHASRPYNLSSPSRRSKALFDALGGRGSQGGDDGGREVRRASQGVNEKGKEDLDLELRLGYYPYW